MSWEDTLKAKTTATGGGSKKRSRYKNLQKIPIAGSPVRGTHGYGESKPRGSKRQQEQKEILEPELRELEGDEE
jgi:hypothetical protein